MAVTRTAVMSWTEGDVVSAISVQKSNELAGSIDCSLTASQADKNIELAFRFAGLSAFWLSADVDVTLETNSSSSPTTTLTITANTPLVWMSGCGITNPFAAGNVTTAYLTSGTATAGTCKIRWLCDGTP